MKNNNKTIGTLLIVSAVALLIPYTILTIIFEYPEILRQETGNYPHQVLQWWKSIDMGLVRFCSNRPSIDTCLHFDRTKV